MIRSAHRWIPPASQTPSYKDKPIFSHVVLTTANKSVQKTSDSLFFQNFELFNMFSLYRFWHWKFIPDS